MDREVVPELAAQVDARLTELQLPLADFVKATGLTRQGLAPLLKGVRKKYQQRLTWPVCRVLGWTPDSIERILNGDPPQLLEAAPAGTVSQLDEVLEQLERQAQALRTVLRVVRRLDALGVDVSELPDDDFLPTRAAR